MTGDLGLSMRSNRPVTTLIAEVLPSTLVLASAAFAIALLLCTYTGRFVYPMLSLEGRKFWVLGLLPFFMAGLLFFANHDFIAILWTDPAGIQIANIVLGMMAVGALWLYKLIQIRV